MALPKIKEVQNILSFVKKSVTKGGFRYVTNYVSGLITLAKKTVRKIASASKEIKYQSSLNNILTKAKFDKETLEKRYLRKIKFMFNNFDVYLIIDDTLVERNGKHIEETKSHFDHNENKYLKGHQFFTSLLYTPFMQLPLFPELYSDNTLTKIEMARSLVDKLSEAKIKINTILFDSWYSDEELMKKCLSCKTRVIGAIKTNRNIMPKWKRRWIKLSYISEFVRSKRMEKFEIEKTNYEVYSTKARLHHISDMMKLIISYEMEENEGILEVKNKAHLISSNPEETPENLIITYKLRWKIETFHRDIKQNLGFAKVFFRRREGIVRHAILAIIAYAVLSLFIYRTNQKMTIGECCEHIRDKSTKEAIGKIVTINKKEERIQRFLDEFF
jgi:SRSO17 transposase